jgi:hypothetical protein
VGVDVVDLLWPDAGVLKGEAHAASGALAVRAGHDDVVGVPRGREADYLDEDRGAACLGVAQLFEHEDAGAFR